MRSGPRCRADAGPAVPPACQPPSWAHSTMKPSIVCHGWPYRPDLCASAGERRMVTDRAYRDLFAVKGFAGLSLGSASTVMVLLARQRVVGWLWAREWLVRR